MKTTIKGVKLTKGRTLSPTYSQKLDDGTERIYKNVECDQLYHDDMAKAMARIKPHLAVICDLKEMDMITDIHDSQNEALNGLVVTGFTISGSEDNEGVSIIGTKKIADKVLNLISPFTEFDSDYQYGSELAEAIEACIFETGEYLFNGKYAIKQLELEFKDDETSEFDQEAAQVSSAVLAEIGDKIFNDTGVDQVSITAKKGKSKKKDNVIQLTQAGKAESF